VNTTYLDKHYKTSYIIGIPAHHHFPKNDQVPTAVFLLGVLQIQTIPEQIPFVNTREKMSEPPN